MRNQDSVLMGVNPVTESFKGDITIERLFILKGLNSSVINTIIKKARQRGITPEFVDKARLDEISNGGVHQGICAFITEFKYFEVSDMLSLARDRGEAPFLYLLDKIEDPRNLGAIIRNANLTGAHGVIIPKRGSATLTSVCAKASAGAVSHTMVARVTNLKNTIEELKNEGLWFVCAEADGEELYKLDLKGAIGLVIGGEGKGVSRLIREACDFTASIPMNPISGEVNSYNAAVASGIIGAEILRQRMLNG